MDVTCERCGTEYEFEETLVSDRGTTVKCTHCGHLFKVYRGGRPSSPSGKPDPWTIRRRNGTTLTISALRDLQRFISRGELTIDDEISRAGEPWKALGSIAELQTFFAAARALRSVPPSSVRPRPDATAPFLAAAANTPYRPPTSTRPAMPDVTPPGDTTVRDDVWAQRSEPRPSASGQLFPQPPAPGPPPFQPRVAPPPRTGSTLRPGAPAPAPAQAMPRTTLANPAVAPPAPVQPMQVVPIQSQRPAPLQSQRPVPPRPAVVSRDAVAQTLPARPISYRPPQSPAGNGQPVTTGQDAQKPPSHQAPMRLHLDEDDAQLAIPKRGNRLGLWIGLVVVAVLLGVVAAAWSQIMPLLGIGASDDRLAGFIARGDSSLARDEPTAYAAAAREYIRATALDERSARALSSLATVNAAWAQLLAFRAGDLEAAAVNDATLRGEATRLRAEQQEKADEARRYAEDALRADPASVAAEIALSDALRLSGDRSGARNHLARATAAQPDPSAELLLVSALLQADQASGNLALARADLERAVRKAPSLLRARLTLARALLAARDVAAARAQIDAVLALAPDHVEAVHLRTAIDRGLPPAAPVLVVADAGVPDAAAAIAPAPPAPPVVAVPPVIAVPAPGAPEAPPPQNRDYDWYVEQADERITRGDIGGAREYANEALGLRPNGSEALTILGAVASNTRDFDRAADLYRRAAQQGYSDAWVELGDTYRAMGRRADAIAAYEEYLNRRPEGSRASAARLHIDNLRGQDPPSSTPPIETAPPAPEPEPPPPPSADPHELPPPLGTDPNQPPPSSDTPAVGSEP